VKISEAAVEALRKKAGFLNNLTSFMTKRRVLVLSFPSFTDISHMFSSYGNGLKWGLV
jgi:hypothetical protein